MEPNPTLHSLKLKLAQYGPLRPEAWHKISINLKESILKEDERFNRENFSIAYVANGILKEYDAQSRKKPAIVNFISSGNFIITTKHNQNRYLKVISPATIVYLSFEDLLSLFLVFRELKPIYDAAIFNYEEGLSFRHGLLEARLAIKRMQLFIAQHRNILSYLKKKDISNYCNIPYDNFVRHYNNLL